MKRLEDEDIQREQESQLNAMDTNPFLRLILNTSGLSGLIFLLNNFKVLETKCFLSKNSRGEDSCITHI
jgi:hypothetical protein